MIIRLGLVFLFVILNPHSKWILSISYIITGGDVFS